MTARDPESEVARLRDVVAQHERVAPKVADEGIGLFLELRDAHGYDEDRARARAVIEVDEGTRAIDDNSRHEAGAGVRPCR